MPPKGKGRTKVQPKLVGQLLPQLAKPTTAIGDFVEIQGVEWGSCHTRAMICGADLLSGRPPLRPEHEPGIPGNAGLHWLKREGVHAAH